MLAAPNMTFLDFRFARFLINRIQISEGPLYSLNDVFLT